MLNDHNNNNDNKNDDIDKYLSNNLEIDNIHICNKNDDDGLSADVCLMEYKTLLP